MQVKLNILYISTDKAADPKNILGITKLISEIKFKSLTKK